MNRIEFDNLSIKKQVEYVNSQLELGLSLRKISEDIDIQRKSIRLRFRKAGYEFNQENNKYIYLGESNEKTLEEYKTNTNVFNAEKLIDNSSEYKHNTNVIVEEKNKNNEEYKTNTNVIMEKEATELEEYKPNTIVFEDNIKMDLLSIAEAKEDIFRVIDWVKKQQLEEKIIDIPELKIEMDKLKDEVKVTTIRLYSNVKDEFQEFMEKYKK